MRVLNHHVTGCGKERDGRGRRLTERFTDALAGASRVRVSVQLAHEFIAVAVTEERDIARVEFEHVPGKQPKSCRVAVWRSTLPRPTEQRTRFQ
jgi:hypothetical protein